MAIPDRLEPISGYGDFSTILRQHKEHVGLIFNLLVFPMHYLNHKAAFAVTPDAHPAETRVGV